MVMSRGATTASLEKFARSGQLGPIALGLTRSDITDALGPPTNWLNGTLLDRSALWKYGDAEVYFDDDDRVHLIHFDWFKVPIGGPTLELSPWSSVRASHWKSCRGRCERRVFHSIPARMNGIPSA